MTTLPPDALFDYVLSSMQRAGSVGETRCVMRGYRSARNS